MFVGFGGEAGSSAFGAPLHQLIGEHQLGVDDPFEREIDGGVVLALDVQAHLAVLDAGQLALEALAALGDAVQLDADFEAWEGYEVKVELDRLAEGRKRFRGVLAGLDGDQVGIDLEGEAETAMIPIAWIVEAKLVLTDELMKRGAEGRAARLASDQQQTTE